MHPTKAGRGGKLQKLDTDLMQPTMTSYVRGINARTLDHKDAIKGKPGENIPLSVPISYFSLSLSLS